MGRAHETGWQLVGRLDESQRRGMWFRRVGDTLQLCAGREGDDAYCEIKEPSPELIALLEVGQWAGAAENNPSQITDELHLMAYGFDIDKSDNEQFVITLFTQSAAHPWLRRAYSIEEVRALLAGLALRCHDLRPTFFRFVHGPPDKNISAYLCQDLAVALHNCLYGLVQQKSTPQEPSK